MMNKKEDTCAITYDICVEEKPVTRAEVEAKKRGATDSILMVCVLHLDEQKEMLDGATSSVMIGINGRTNRDLNPSEIFQIWTGLAHELAKQLPDGYRKQLCEDVHTSVKTAIAGVFDDSPKSIN